MFGAFPIRPPVPGDGQTLDVQHVFATIQGEGPNAGTPSVFIRLGGCNLACTFCDTEFETFSPMTLDTLMHTVQGLRGACPLAVITGGEPLRQNIAPLCEALIASGMRVQIETNGTLWREIPEEVEIICSPKNTGQGYMPVRGDVLKSATAIKFLVSKHKAEYDHIPDVGQEIYHTPVYVQPMDEHDPAANAANQSYAMELALKHGCRLSLQLHKILNIE